MTASTTDRPVLPLTALRAFEATMRLGRMGAAAAELGVTHGAVSRQIAVLQALLGARLFEGPRNARTPTPEAVALDAEIAPAFAMLAGAVQRRTAASGRVRLSCLSTLAARWLIPRLPRLAAEAPGVHLDLSESYAPPERALDGGGLAVRMLAPGQTPPPGLVARPFMANPVGVAAPPGVNALDLRRLASRSHPSAWDDWSARTGLTPDPRTPLMFDHQQTMIEAALAGLGACVVQRPLVETELAAGRLAAPFGFQDDGARFVVFHRIDAPDAVARRFIAWLEEEGRVSAPI